MSVADLRIPRLRPGRALTRPRVVQSMRTLLARGYSPAQIAAGYAMAGYMIPPAALGRIAREIRARQWQRARFPKPKKEVQS